MRLGRKKKKLKKKERKKKKGQREPGLLNCFPCAPDLTEGGEKELGRRGGKKKRKGK